MVAPFAYLDTLSSEFIAHGWEMWLHCACGHAALMTIDAFERWPKSSLHRLVAKARCSKCGELGNVPEVRLSVMAAGKAVAGPFFRSLPACCPVGAMNGHA